ncbi:DUF4181 domain-containing protein [Bacillus sp. D386]|uniref:DUF4181 domain-containing protein n=1 Tax=Bacillus sp. D386 TaxID=2587155 RepID=UPI0011214B30|nr:DUF4181 domain-containing protein [Bacillus sp. D386]
MKLLTTVIIIFLVVFFVEKLIEKYLGIKRKFISETPGKRIDRWGRTIIVVIFLSSYFFALTNEVNAILKWNWVLFFTALMGLQTILEWKYIKESKQYISTLISSMIIISILSLLVIRF